MGQAFIVRRGGGSSSSSNALVFDVVGGTTIPSSPKENTVWVNTSTAINNVYAQVYAPANPVAGDVWINTHVTLDANGNPIVSDALTMTVYESPLIRISAKSGQQWDGSAWVKLPTRVYKNGAWSPDVLVVIMDGEWGQLGQPTKGYKGSTALTNITATGGFTLTYSDGYMYIRAKTSSSNASRTDLLYYESPIDVSPYNNMTVVGYTSDSLSNMYVLLNSTIKYVTDTTAEYATARIKNTLTTATADISSATGQKYLGLGMYVGGSSKYPNGYFREVTLSV